MYNNYNPINNHYYIYVDEFMKGNIGKKIEVHVSFSDSIEWRDSVFKGILKAVGKDYLVINIDNKDTVIWSIYIDYIIIL